MSAQTPPGSPRELYDRIGDMLFTNGLDPSPLNFTLGHRYWSGEDPEFNSLVDETIAMSGGLSSVAAAAIVAERSVELSAVDLARLASEAQERLGKIADLMAGSGEEVRSYGAALEENAAGLSAGADPRTIVETLIGLTSAMIARTREVERDLRQTGDDMRGMRASLADAQASAHKDALTGLPNRRALDARFASAIDGCNRDGTALAIAICDIDHFKAINDGFGHQIGDEVIKFVGSSLADKDAAVFTARYGGEEFVVLFEGIELGDAVARIDRIRAAISARELRITATGQTLGKISFSAGVSACNPGDGAYAVLRRADNALYAAKRAGRNQVIAG